MKSKILNTLLLISSLFGYLEWGTDNKSFLFESEYVILKNLITNPGSAIHPFTLIPILGQILLIFTLFQKKPSKSLIYIGCASIGILLGFMFVIGIIALNPKIFISTLPFLIVAAYTIFHLKTQKK